MWLTVFDNTTLSLFKIEPEMKKTPCHKAGAAA